MHPFIRVSSTDYRLLACLLIITATSCIKVTDRIIPDTNIRYDQGVSFDGPPRATLTAHPDHQGWTVTVTQPLKRHVELVRSQREEHHYYYLNPLTFPAGAFACPSSIWGWFWSGLATILNPQHQLVTQETMLDFTWNSCLMALMIVRTAPETVNVDSVVEHRNEFDARPANDGRVTVSWPGSREALVSYPWDEGRALVRLAHIATALRQDHVPWPEVSQGTVQLSAWHQNVLIQQWPLEITREQLEAATRLEIQVMAPRSRWPRPLVFKIVSTNMPNTLPAPEGAFHRLLVQYGMTIVGSTEQQTFARSEIEQNLEGLVEDNSLTGPGHWKPVTVLLLITANQNSAYWGLTVSCINVRTREVLARLDVVAGPDNIQGALDVGLMRFQNVIAALTSHPTH